MDDGTGPRHPAWSLRDFRIQSLGSGERTVVWTGGSAARYVQTGYLIHAQGNSLFAIPFDLDTMETTASPVAEEGGYHFPDSWFGTTLAFRRELSPVGSPDNTANEMDVWTMSVDGGTPGEPQPFRAEPVLQEGEITRMNRDGGDNQQTIRLLRQFAKASEGV